MSELLCLLIGAISGIALRELWCLRQAKIDDQRLARPMNLGESDGSGGPGEEGPRPPPPPPPPPGP